MNKKWNVIGDESMKDLVEMIGECLSGIDPLPMTTKEEERLIKELDDPRIPLQTKGGY